MTAVIDYGVGNLFSLCCSLEAIGEKAVVSSNPDEIRKADKVILPGVGAFSDAIQKLRESGLDTVVKEVAESGTPLLGICIGMQLLFEKSYEFGEHEGLGLIPGSVRPITDVISSDLKIPHIGWNALEFGEKKHPLFAHVENGGCVYFVHSYYAADCAEFTTATTEYGATLTAAVAKGNIMGCQFHPEKSGTLGLAILKSFCQEVAK